MRSKEVTKPDSVKNHIIITIAVMIFIFVHSAMPGDVSGGESRYFAEILASLTGLSFQTAHFIVRKAAHFTEFMILGLCLTVNCHDLKAWTDLGRTEQTPGMAVRGFFAGHPLLSAWILGTLYACTDEFHQRFVEGRSCEFRDVCIDSAGVVAGLLIAALVKAIKSRAKTSEERK